MSIEVNPLGRAAFVVHNSQITHQLGGRMTRQLILGSAVGLVGGLMSWRGNQTPHLVSTFPDVWTFVVFMVLVTSVVWLELGRQAVPNRSAALRLGAAIGSAAGVVFGTVLVVLGVFQFTTPLVG